MTNYIQQKIKLAGGQISFAKFMQMALYTSNLGYYSSQVQKFGITGDFVTAPMLGTIFANCVANKCLELFKNSTNRNILELGAGDGQLAKHLITILNENEQSKLNNYFILEPSYALRTKQKELLLHDGFKNKIFWLDQVPQNFNGIILANEVLDALPVVLFTIRNKNIWEKFVTVKNNKFIFIEKIANQQLARAVQQLPLDLINYTQDIYNSEVCLLIPKFLKSLADKLQRGAILLIDYGFSAKDYYHPERRLGTLMCHYQHHSHGDPFFYPGLQDITAHVDFSLVIEHAVKNNLRVAEFYSMANFLMNNGLQLAINKFKINNDLKQLKLNQELNTLISPSEMGEIFKVLLLIKE